MSKFIRVTMPNGEQWDVPAEIIIVSRANYYAAIESNNDPEKFDKIYAEEYRNTLNDDDLIIEWAREKFKWDDVEFIAFKAMPPPRLTREKQQEAWKKGNMVVVSKV